MNHPDFMIKMLPGNKKYIFSRFQLYALAYVRITTLRPWQHKNWKGKILRIWITIIRHGGLGHEVQESWPYLSNATPWPGGGVLGYFLGGYVPPRTPNWHPVLEKISPKIDTPFQKWANFLYPVLGCNKSTTVCLLMHWTVFLKAICPWILSNGCLQK